MVYGSFTETIGNPTVALAECEALDLGLASLSQVDHAVLSLQGHAQGLQTAAHLTQHCLALGHAPGQVDDVVGVPVPERPTHGSRDRPVEAMVQYGVERARRVRVALINAALAPRVAA